MLSWKLCIVGVVCLLGASGLRAQTQSEGYGRKNTWSVFTEYSNDSSHIFLGITRDRKVADAGVAYSRRFWQTRMSSLSYVAELRPVLFESDPTTTSTGISVTSSSSGSTTTTGFGSGDSFTVTTLGKCVPASGTFSFPGPNPGDPPIVYSYSFTCGRRWTFGQAFSPAGLKYSFGTNRRVQPFAVITGGYMYTNRPIPVETAGSFNFTFDFGGGVEVFRSKTHSVSLEARVHHFSNKNSALSNPGTDSVRFKASYNFGR